MYFSVGFMEQSRRVLQSIPSCLRKREEALSSSNPREIWGRGGLCGELSEDDISYERDNRYEEERMGERIERHGCDGEETIDS